MRLIFKILGAFVWLVAHLSVLTARLAVGLVLGFVNLFGAIVQGRSRSTPPAPGINSPQSPGKPQPARRSTHWLE